MSSSFTLSRACKACNQLKVRCHPSATDLDTCERCQHAGRECIPAGRRRRPRDRIAELEAQVADLTKSLQRQRVSPQAANTKALANEKTVSQGGGKPVVNTAEEGDAGQVPMGSKAIMFLDTHVPLATQQEAIERYVRDLYPTFPAVPLLDTNLGRLRREAPVLLFSIITFATSYLLSTKARNELIQEAMRIFAMELISKPSRRLEMVWALLIASYWFRSRPGISHVTIHQLVQLATGMAIDIGIGGNQMAVTPGAGDSETCPPSSPTARRAWLACFVAASTLSTSIRRSDTNAQWTYHHDECLASPSLLCSMEPTDRLFIHIVRGQKLCYQIATALALCDPTHLWDFASNESQQVISKLRKDIDDWTADTCSGAQNKPLLYYRYSAIAYLNEPILHTSTNKLTFGTPLRPEKIAESDFARPNIKGGHVSALYALRDSCHDTLDLATEPASSAFLATCPLPYVSKVYHALFILAKLYVSVTAPGNTYGAVLRPADLRLEQYFERMSTLSATIEDFNPGSFNSRILNCHFALGDWFKGYVANVNRSQRIESSASVNFDTLEGVDNSGALTRVAEQPSQINDDAQWLLMDNYHSWINEFIPDDMSFA